jgi:tetratricopeptide (TPR) repeat protein
MTRRALLPLLLLALPLRAADPPPEIIGDAALEPGFQELRARLEQVRKNALPIEEFVQYYQQRAQAKGTPRQRAEAAFFYGFVLHSVVGSGKESKEAKREFQRAIDLRPGLLRGYAELASVASEAGDRAEAERLLRRALELDEGYVRAMVEAFPGLIVVNIQLFRKCFDEKEKERLAQAALAAADALVTFEPDNAAIRLGKAQVLLDLGRVKQAIDFLEGLYEAGTLKPDVQAHLLRLLRGIYQSQVDVGGVQVTIERLLKCDALRPEERARYASRAKDLRGMGRNAFTKWGIEDAVAILHNPGLSVEDRLSVLRRLQEFITSDLLAVPDLRDLVILAWRECIRILVDGPPELQAVQLRALRDGRYSARLLAVLVHFVYPGGRTEEVREEGLRTVAACGGVAAIPALYFSLQDASGRVVREADNQLSALCERRSPFGGGIEPLTDEQRTQALRLWTAYFRSEEGAARLAKAFRELSRSVLRVEPDRTSAPMIDHAARVILDGDIPWTAWAAAYDFLVQYWGKDFRPVERRGKPVEPFERDAVRDAFDKDYAPEAEPEAPPADAAAPAGMSGK